MPYVGLIDMRHLQRGINKCPSSQKDKNVEKIERSRSGTASRIPYLSLRAHYNIVLSTLILWKLNIKIY